MSAKTILITGCSTGIGYHTAIELDKRGYNVIASCRKQEDVQRLIDKGLDAIMLDVNDNQSIAKAFELVKKKTNNRLDVLINNAGYGQSGALEDLSRDALRAQFETNVFGLMEVTRHAIPLMRLQGQGRIINISSILGLVSLPFRGAYNASKYAVEGLTDTLRLELKSSGIHVISIQPGPIKSHFRDSSLQHALEEIDVKQSHFKKTYQFMQNYFKEKKEASSFTKSPQMVVKKLLKAIEAKHPRPSYKVTTPAFLLSGMKRLLTTRLLDKMLLAISKKELS